MMDREVSITCLVARERRGVSADVINDRGGKSPAQTHEFPPSSLARKSVALGCFSAKRNKKRVANAHPQNQKSLVQILMLRVSARIHRAGGFYRSKQWGQAEKTRDLLICERYFSQNVRRLT